MDYSIAVSYTHLDVYKRQLTNPITKGNNKELTFHKRKDKTIK